MGNTGSGEKGCFAESTGKTPGKTEVTRAGDKNCKNVMGKYEMDMTQDGLMGAGTSSICRKGTVIGTDQEVGIKLYKTPKSGKMSEEDVRVRLQKFIRQVEVLKELQEPFVKPSDPRLWCPALDTAKPQRLFMRLVDCSTDAAGALGPYPADNQLYVITELAQYSLKDYLAQRKSENAPISKETVRDMAKALVYVMAGLHAKGFVHLDLKPENLMVFDGALKLIDVDGCVKVDMSIAITNPSISFSPCYCSPEWANFLLAENEAHIVAKPALDVWSVGCTICELVTLDAILKPMYANFLRHSHSHREAGFLFMDWLSSIKKGPTPKAIFAFDKDLGDLIGNWLLVTDKTARKTCAESLSSPYFAKAHLHHSKTNPLNKTGDGLEDDVNVVSTKAQDSCQTRRLRHRVEDHSSKAMYKGTLWKLNTGKDANDASQWLQRDMWLANNGSLCYFSIADSKRLVLLDAYKLHEAKISRLTGSAKEHSFQIRCETLETDATDGEVFTFAAASAEELEEWLRFIQQNSTMDGMPTVRLGASFGLELKNFMLSVRNRRMKVENDSEKQFEPVFEGTIWKVKGSGDPMKEEDWFSRKTWLSRNGSLVYWSVRESRELVYYTSADVHRAEVVRSDDSKSLKPWSFEVNLPPHEGMHFQKGQFAAESEEMREQWIKEFAKFRV